MLEQKEHFHGSDLEKIEKIYHIKKEDIISFAANVNPLGVSPLLKRTLADKIDVITSYPDREYTSLRQSIAGYCCCDADDILVGNGCTELISLFIQITAPKKTLLLGPTYSEYERDLKLEGSEINKAKEILTNEGIIIMYTNEIGFVKKHLRLNQDYRLIQETCIQAKGDFYLLIMTLKR